ncbi:MAG: AMP-binding protein [Nitrospirota bacterium]|nr:AMP-binding protein [Nitrospirota bacterium]
MVNESSVNHVPGSGELRENNVNSVLEKNAALFPDRAALKWVCSETFKTWDSLLPLPHESITYQDFAGLSARLARGLKGAGIKKGDRVIIFLPMSLELYLTVCAVMRIGAISVFLDVWTKKQLDASAHQAEPKALIVPETVLSAFPALNAIPLKIVAGQHSQKNYTAFSSLFDTPEDTYIEPVSPDTPALITYTTGSSGVPKGAVRTHQFLAAQHHALDQCIPYLETDIDLPTFPIFSLNNLACGITSVLPAITLATPSEKDARILVSQMLSEKVTCCTFAPARLARVTEYCHLNRIDLSHIRRVVTGGAPADKEVLRGLKAIAPGALLLVLYGSTEAEPIASIDADELLRDTSARAGVNVGKIVRDLEFKFIRLHRGDIELDEQGWGKWELPHGEVGELVVSGPHVCREYYRNPPAFQRNKIKDAGGKVWHRTGDVGFLDEHDRLWIAGRVHNAIFREKTCLFPVYAEILLKTLEFVRQAAYAGIEDEVLGEKACVIISLRHGFGIENRGQYREQILALFKTHKMPVDEIRIVGEIPMDPRHHSKVDYAKLKEMPGE